MTALPTYTVDYQSGSESYELFLAFYSSSSIIPGTKKS